MGGECPPGCLECGDGRADRRHGQGYQRANLLSAEDVALIQRVTGQKAQAEAILAAVSWRELGRGCCERRLESGWADARTVAAGGRGVRRVVDPAAQQAQQGRHGPVAAVAHQRHARRCAPAREPTTTSSPRAGTQTTTSGFHCSSRSQNHLTRPCSSTSSISAGTLSAPTLTLSPTCAASFQAARLARRLCQAQELRSHFRLPRIRPQAVRPGRVQAPLPPLGPYPCATCPI